MSSDLSHNTHFLPTHWFQCCVLHIINYACYPNQSLPIVYNIYYATFCIARDGWKVALEKHMIDLLACSIVQSNHFNHYKLQHEFHAPNYNTYYISPTHTTNAQAHFNSSLSLSFSSVSAPICISRAEVLSFRSLSSMSNSTACKEWTTQCKICMIAQLNDDYIFCTNTITQLTLFLLTTAQHYFPFEDEHVPPLTPFGCKYKCMHKLQY